MSRTFDKILRSLIRESLRELDDAGVRVKQGVKALNLVKPTTDKPTGRFSSLGWLLSTDSVKSREFSKGSSRLPDNLYNKDIFVFDGMQGPSEMRFAGFPGQFYVICAVNDSEKGSWMITTKDESGNILIQKTVQASREFSSPTMTDAFEVPLTDDKGTGQALFVNIEPNGVESTGLLLGKLYAAPSTSFRLPRQQTLPGFFPDSNIGNFDVPLSDLIKAGRKR